MLRLGYSFIYKKTEEFSNCKICGKELVLKETSGYNYFYCPDSEEEHHEYLFHLLQEYKNTYSKSLCELIRIDISSMCYGYSIDFDEIFKNWEKI